MNKRFLQGFTLTELLIAITVIGIIVAITVPGVVNRYQKDSQITAIKKVYADFEQALELLQGEYATRRNLRLSDTYLGANLGDVTREDAKNPSDTAGRFLRGYFKIAKDCGTSSKGCFADTYKSIDGTDVSSYVAVDSKTRYYVQLANGAAISISPPYSMSLPGKGYGAASPFTTVGVDTNGPDKPNIGGRDMFSFIIGSDFRIERGYGPECTTVAAGVNCLHDLIENNWKMNY